MRAGEEDVVELTGADSLETRGGAYREKKVFCMTPQTMVNDLNRGIIDIKKIVLVVFDEAHRATGDYAYSLIQKKIRETGGICRTIALSATPGNSISTVKEVLDNLNITKIEIRTEEELQKYLKHKEIEVVGICKEVQIQYICQKIDKLLSCLRTKISECVCLDQEAKLMPKDGKSLTYKSLKRLADSYTQNIEAYQELIPTKYSRILPVINNMQSLLFGKRLLVEQGLPPFEEFFRQYREDVVLDIKRARKDKEYKPDIVRRELIQKTELRDVAEALRLSKLKFGIHSKLLILHKILRTFFSSELTIEQQSKAIVFVQSRKVATEIVEYLKKKAVLQPRRQKSQGSESQPWEQGVSQQDIRVSLFVGQATRHGSKGMDAVEQQRAIAGLKSGELNVLVATSVGEEGLDLGEVDLIVCFDSGLTPIRMVQRMGRTGRQRKGRVIMLLTSSEKEIYEESQERHSLILTLLAYNAAKKSGKELSPNQLRKLRLVSPQDKEFNLQGFSPRMVPPEVYPKNKMIFWEEQEKSSQQQSISEEEEQQEQLDDLIDHVVVRARRTSTRASRFTPPPSQQSQILESSSKKSQNKISP